MAKKGVKVKELSRELGVTSRELMERCRASGILAQNSITKLPEPTVRTIRAWYATSEPSSASGDGRSDDTVSPV